MKFRKEQAWIEFMDKCLNRKDRKHYCIIYKKIDAPLEKTYSLFKSEMAPEDFKIEYKKGGNVTKPSINPQNMTRFPF